jgi:hypothetical protein
MAIYESDFYNDNPILKDMNPLTRVKFGLMGFLHIWQIDNPQDDLYIQSEDDIKIILDNLPEVERDSINRGYEVLTHCIPDDYFLID